MLNIFLFSTTHHTRREFQQLSLGLLNSLRISFNSDEIALLVVWRDPHRYFVLILNPVDYNAKILLRTLSHFTSSTIKTSESFIASIIILRIMQAPGDFGVSMEDKPGERKVGDSVFSIRSLTKDQV